jgi:predicted transcriptional regulator
LPAVQRGVIDMSTVKDVMIKVIQDQPEDSNFDEILKELAFIQMVNRGLADSDAGRTVPHEEIAKRLF